jgi:hypothetical protein
MTYRKHEFTTAQWATLRKLIEVESVMPDGTTATAWSDLVTAVHEIGHLVTTPAVIKDGKVTKEAVLSPLWAVDIVWADKPLKQFDKHTVWPSSVGRHIFAGYEEQYKRDRDELRN